LTVLGIIRIDLATPLSKYSTECPNLNVSAQKLEMAERVIHTHQASNNNNIHTPANLSIKAAMTVSTRKSAAVCNNAKAKRGRRVCGERL
jgi:hypothetical protein